MNTDRVASPTQVLAERIIQRLVREGLVVAGDAARFQSRLIDGAAKAEDWRIAVEKSMAAASRGEEPPR